MKLFVISVDDKPGALAEICDAVKPAKVKYIATQKSGYGKGFIKIVTDDDNITKSNLLGKNYMFIEEPLILAKTGGNTDSIHELTNTVGSAGINIENLFAFEPEVLAMIISPQDVDNVKELLGDRVLEL
jgi:hypothetical protein